MNHMVTEVTHLPDGMDRDDFNAPSFQVVVIYRGNGRYAVATSREAHQQLTKTGKWVWLPLKMTAMRWCRFDFDEAMELAAEAVNTRKVNGKTWAEWEASA